MLSVTGFQIIVGVDKEPPSDLPVEHLDVQQVTVPATTAFTRAQLHAKSLLWPTNYSPHLLPQAPCFRLEDISRVENGMKLALEGARQAVARGEVSRVIHIPRCHAY